MAAKNAYIIAGPNGSGKTTFANKFLPYYAKCDNFVNADLIAKGLSPFSPNSVAIKAGKLVLDRITELVDKCDDFGFESTISGKTYEKRFKQLKHNGYKLHLFFLWIPSARLGIARIKNRVANENGHHVPDGDVRRRFGRSIKNFFNTYMHIVDSWILFDNSGYKPTIIAKKNNGSIETPDKDLFEKIVKQTGVKI